MISYVVEEKVEGATPGRSLEIPQNPPD